MRDFKSSFFLTFVFKGKDLLGTRKIINAHECFPLLPFPLVFKKVLFSQVELMFPLGNNIKSFTCKYGYRKKSGTLYDYFYFFQFAYVFKKFLLYYLNNKKYFKEYYCITIQGGFTRVLSFFPFYQFKK